MGLLLNIGNIIGGAITAPFTIIVGTVIGVIILLAVSFAWISGAVLYVVTSPWFFSWGYTNNPVVKIGLDITKNFVNLALVIALVFIALAITLRIKEYGSQRTLARLVIVALLVNFAPVLVGLIVDASNIVMSFFLVQIKEGVTSILSGISIEKINAVVVDIIKLFTGTLTTKGSILAKGVVYAVLCFILGLALLLYAFIFLFRYIAIWLLVILSPLAFVSWILPATKKFWNMWWEQLIQWSIIGIPMAFFLYLAMATYGELNAHFGKNLPLLPSLDEITVGVLNDIFPYYMVLALLYLGFFIGLQTSAMGANSVINLAKKAGRGTIRGAKWGARQTAGKFLASEKGKEAMKSLRIKTAREGWKEAKTIPGGLLRGGLGLAATVSGARWAVRGVKKAGLVYGASQEKKIEEEKKNIEQEFGNDYERAGATYDSILPFNYHKKIALARYLKEKKGGKGLETLGDKNLERAVELTATYSPGTLVDLIKHKQSLIKKDRIGEIIKQTMVGKTPETQMENKDVKTLMRLGMNAAEAVEKAAFKKATDALKEKDVENLTDEIDMPEFREMTARFKNWGFINKIGLEKGLDWVQRIQKTAQEEIGIAEIAKTNSSFLRAAYTPAGSMFLVKWKREKGKGMEIKGTKEINMIIQDPHVARLVSDGEVGKKQKEYIEEQIKKPKKKPKIEETGAGV